MTQRSEAFRGLIRITANYGRLITTFLIGLVFVPLALRFGNDAFGLILLMGVSNGLLGMIDEIINWSMVRELGSAYHSNDERKFRAAASTAYVVCFGAALVLLAAFGILALVLPWLEIDAALLPAARWYVLFSAVQAFVRMNLAPATSMYLISERMVMVSLWEISYRLLDLIAVAATLALAWSQHSSQVICYAMLYNALLILQWCAAAALMISMDRRLFPSLRLVSRQSAIAFVKMSGWNTAVSLAMNLGNRTDAIIMNKFFGLNGNVIFGLALQISAYVRMIGYGMTIGVDAVATRIATVADAQAIRSLVNYATRMHGWVAFPAGLGCCFLVEPFLHVWVGNRISDPVHQIPQIVAITRVLAIALTVRSISDGWTRVLYGAGYIRTYAPLVFVGALFNPFLSVLLLFLFPASIRYTAPAWAHSSLFVLFHLVFLPRLVSRRLGIGLENTLAPLGRPLVASLVGLPVLIWGNRHLQHGDLLGLCGVVAAYGAIFAVVSWLVVLDGAERRRFANAARRRILRRAGDTG